MVAADRLGPLYGPMRLVRLGLTTALRLLSPLGRSA